MSTNDTVLLVANGAAGGEKLKGSELAKFRTCPGGCLRRVGQGHPRRWRRGHAPGHDRRCRLRHPGRGAANRQDSRRKPLVKTAIAGADPNWGRIVSAAGYAGVSFDPAGVCLRVNGVLLYEHGRPTEFDRAGVSRSIRENRDTSIELKFVEGAATSAVLEHRPDGRVRPAERRLHDMNGAMRRIRRGEILLALILLLSVCGYRLLGRSWLDALYMVVITVATVGYGEHSDLPDLEKWWTIGVIVFGISAAAYTIGGLIQFLAEGEIEKALGGAA